MTVSRVEERGATPGPLVVAIELRHEGLGERPARDRVDQVDARVRPGDQHAAAARRRIGRHRGRQDDLAPAARPGRVLDPEALGVGPGDDDVRASYPARSTRRRRPAGRVNAPGRGTGRTTNPPRVDLLGRDRSPRGRPGRASRGRPNRPTATAAVARPSRRPSSRRPRRLGIDAQERHAAETRGPGTWRRSRLPAAWIGAFAGPGTGQRRRLDRRRARGRGGYSPGCPDADHSSRSDRARAKAGPDGDGRRASSWPPSGTATWCRTRPRRTPRTPPLSPVAQTNWPEAVGVCQVQPATFTSWTGLTFDPSSSMTRICQRLSVSESFSGMIR